MTTTLNTERLRLRALEDRDAEDMFIYARNPKVGPPAGWAPHTSLEETARIIQMLREGECNWGIEYRETGQLIGTIGLHKDDKRNIRSSRMIGFVLSEPFWGRGLMVEAAREVMRYAFEYLQLDILCAIHFPFNQQSRRVIEKCGLRYEGTFRMATQIYSGEIYDDVCYSITREEFFASL